MSWLVLQTFLNIEVIVFINAVASNKRGALCIVPRRRGSRNSIEAGEAYSRGFSEPKRREFRFCSRYNDVEFVQCPQASKHSDRHALGEEAHLSLETRREPAEYRPTVGNAILDAGKCD